MSHFIVPPGHPQTPTKSSIRVVQQEFESRLDSPDQTVSTPVITADKAVAGLESCSSHLLKTPVLCCYNRIQRLFEVFH